MTLPLASLVELVWTLASTLGGVVVLVAAAVVARRALRAPHRDAFYLDRVDEQLAAASSSSSSSASASSSSSSSSSSSAAAAAAAPAPAPPVLMITGAAGGMGAHLVSCALRRSRRVCVVALDLSLDALSRVATQRGWPAERTLVHALDCADRTHWRAALDATRARFPQGVSVLLNVAGIIAPGRLGAAGGGDGDARVVGGVAAQARVNFLGAVYGAEAVLDDMRALARRGHIINISSVAGLCPVPGNAGYAASKAALRAWTLSESASLAARCGVALSVVCPGPVVTDMLRVQLHQPDAYMTFAETHYLGVGDVEQALFDNVLVYRQPELWLPRAKGVLCMLANVAPELMALLDPLLRRVARQQVDRLRALFAANDAADERSGASEKNK